RLVDAVTGDEVAHADVRRAVAVEDDRFVVLTDEELEAPDPNEPKVIEVTRFVPESSLDLAWYARPYYLDPDGSGPDFFAFTEVLADAKRIGLASWTMRRTPYHGAL